MLGSGGSATPGHPLKPHDHAHGPACSHAAPPAEAVARAEELCAARGLRLTPIRREVLSALAASATPLGAYDLIDRLRTPDGRRPAPITVYRALDFLVENGAAHRIESRNAYVACGHGHAGADVVVFMICDACGCVSEASDAGLRAGLDGLAARAGFAPASRVVEMFGRCGHCA